MLRTFQAFQIAKEIYASCKLLRLPNFLRDQLLRASSSVALNLAEGSGKRTEKEQERFYSIAPGSLREVEAVLELENVFDRELLAKVDRLGAMLFSLSRKTVNRTVPKQQPPTDLKPP